MKLNRRLIRAACRVHAAYHFIREEDGLVDLPETEWRDAAETYRLWKAVRHRRWPIAARRQRERYTSALDWLVGQLRGRLGRLNARQPCAPSLRLLYEELTAIEAEFPGITLSKGELLITTEPVTLEAIELGPFQIALQLDRLAADTPYSLTALEANPATCCDETVHPHVHAGKLCAGEGRAAITAALAEGRLFDFATIIDRILRTYNCGSAYTELADWYGVRCRECDTSVNAEDASTCSHCEDRVCNDCVILCGGCSDGYCSSCIDRCGACEEYFCSGCLQACAGCRRSVCSACLEDEFCPTCHTEREEADESNETDETPLEPDAASESPV